MRKLFALSVLVLLILTIPEGGGTNAQNAGLQISPTKTTINASPGDRKQLNFDVRNASDRPALVGVSYSNFTTSPDESGEPQVTTEQIPYGLSSWLSNTKNLPSLGVGKTGIVSVNMSVPKDTKPGTYYGIVRVADASSGSTAHSASVASLLFVNIGQITQTIAIEEFKTADDLFVARIKNTGNGYLIPEVKIEIFDKDNQLIETPDANMQKGGIIPGTIRKYAVSLSDKIEPNTQYKAILSVKTESAGPATTKEISLGNPATEEVAIGPTKDKKAFSSLGLIASVIGILLLVLTILMVILIRKHHRLHSSRPHMEMPDSLVSSTPALPTTPTPEHTPQDSAPTEPKL